MLFIHLNETNNVTYRQVVPVERAGKFFPFLLVYSNPNAFNLLALLSFHSFIFLFLLTMITLSSSLSMMFKQYNIKTLNLQQKYSAIQDGRTRSRIAGVGPIFYLPKL